MAKGKQMKASDLPTVESPPAQSKAEQPQRPKAKPEPKKTVEVTQTSLTIEVPCLDGVQGYCRRRVDITFSREQARKLKGVTQALEQDGARLKNGRFVSTPMHALMWLVENLG